MGHAAHGTRVQDYIGDPLSDAPVVPREQLEEIFEDIQSDLRYDFELNGCLNWRHLHSNLSGGALLRLLAARDRPVALDRESRRHLRRHAGEDMGLRAVLHLCRPMSLLKLAGRSDHADARSRHQARHAVGEGRAPSPSRASCSS